jgi:cyclomaltodextrinase / maltogenic alpha-amylase / neopullulanase
VRHPSSGSVAARVPLATLSLVAIALAAVFAVVGPDTPGDVGTTTSSASAWATASSAAWPDDAVVYHVFVDRFADGDQPDTQVRGIPDDAGYAAALTDWMGGDLAGVRARLDHVVASGANTIWLSPVTPGPYFHGYHPTDLTDVDPRFGDLDELRALVDDAHDLGLKVIHDLVLNHTSDRHPWFRAAQADCDGSEYVAYYRFRTCPDHYAAFAGLPELPQLDPDHPPLRAHIFDDVLPFWLDDVGVDGFRLDHVVGPSRDFWGAMRDELAQRWPDTLVLGEVWEPESTIASYGDVLDAATAFPFRDRLAVVFARGGATPAAALGVRSWLDDDGTVRSGIPRPSTYLSSHDQPRFTWEADGDTDRTVLAYRTILTLPGLPVVYYGDEIGLTQTGSLPDGASFQDRWYREPMPWDPDEWDIAAFESIAATARLRTTTPALHRGTYTELLADGPLWVFERSADDQRVLVVVNNDEVATSVDLAEVLPTDRLADADVADLLAGDDTVHGVTVEAGEITVPPLGIAVLAID